MVSPISPRRRRLASLVLVCCLGGCVTTAVSVPKKPLPAEVAVAEKDLLAPLRPQNIVIANHVLVQVSPNFFNKVTRPSGPSLPLRRSSSAFPSTNRTQRTRWARPSLTGRGMADSITSPIDDR